jgi:hypothetical protein
MLGGFASVERWLESWRTNQRRTMHFTYEGFTQNQGRRCFTFRGIEERYPVSVFCLELDLPLFAQNRIAVQEGPMFCLQLLRTAFLTGPSFLEKLQHYQILAEDLRPLLVEREKRAAEKALKKTPHRPLQKPLSVSQIQLTASSRGH